MLKVERISVVNMENAIRGARNPMNSWARMDSYYNEKGEYVLGENDLALASKLAAAGSDHRNHCPNCLYSLHVDIEPGDRESDCGGHMEPVAVWVRNKGEWAIIHRCKMCGGFSSNRVAADDNPMKLMSIAMKPIGHPPFPIDRIEEMTKMMGGEGSLN